MFDYAALHRAITALRRKRIFFIGGVMKSGTTWLQLLLNQHPDIACHGEAHIPSYLIPLFVKTIDEYNEHIAWKNGSIFDGLEGYPTLRDEHRTYLWASSVAFLLAEQLKRKPARVVGEKTPDNVRFFTLLDAAFPRARFIQIVRDGRDCAVSCWFHNLRTNPDWARSVHPSLSAYATMFAREWAADIASAEQFAAAYPNACLTVRYEDLLANTSSVLRGVLAFLGVPTGAEVAARCVGAAAFERLADGRRRGEENRESFFRYGTQGNWREHLDQATNDAFIATAEPWLARFGYLESGSARIPMPARVGVG